MGKIKYLGAKLIQIDATGGDGRARAIGLTELLRH